MKKLILLIMLTGMTGLLHAQQTTTAALTKTDAAFNIDAATINHRHTVQLRKNEQMIIELGDAADYDLLANLDSLLRVFTEDIAFYRDSLATTGNVRIDYSFNPGTYPGNYLLNKTRDYRQIRFKKYQPDGDIFLRQADGISKLKLEQDTVRLVLRKLLDEREGKAHRYDYPVQITFLVNSYTDIAAIAADGAGLRHIIDTLATVAATKKYEGEQNHHQTTIEYAPYINAGQRFRSTNVMVTGDKDWHIRKGFNTINIAPTMGLGLVRNTLAPMAQLSIELEGTPKYGRRWNALSKNSMFFRVSAAPYFLFGRNAAGSNIINDNWFVNAEIGEYRVPGKGRKEVSVGAGYLFRQKGGYFENATFKIFANRWLSHHIIISPELIFTNNFQQIFPGITLKVY